MFGLKGARETMGKRPIREQTSTMAAKVTADPAGVSVDGSQRKVWPNIATGKDHSHCYFYAPWSDGTLVGRLLPLAPHQLLARLRLLELFGSRSWHPAELAALRSAESRLELRRSAEGG